MLKKYLLRRIFKKHGKEYIISFFDHWLNRREYESR